MTEIKRNVPDPTDAPPAPKEDITIFLRDGSSVDIQDIQAAEWITPKNGGDSILVVLAKAGKSRLSFPATSVLYTMTTVVED